MSSASLPRLIEPADLAAATAAPDDDLLLVNVVSAESHAAGHVPGARWLSPAALVAGAPPRPGDLPDGPRLAGLVEWLGLDPQRHVVAMDDEGGGWAGRLLWTLAVLGHPRWSLLDGGVRAWAGDGLPLASGVDPEDRPQAVVGADPELDRRHLIVAEDLLARLGADDLVVWDCRSAEEYSGARRNAARGGHIPGARHLDWLDLMDPERGLRLRRDLEELLAQRGITRDAEVVVHCQTHHRSALAWVAARLLDFPRLRAYPGSWAEWGNRPDLPVVEGQADG